MSDVSAIAFSRASAVNTERSARREKNNLLGKDAFLELLVTQLRHQDPLSPMDDKQFIAQMAQFTALEQAQNLNGQMQRLNALAMLGKSVTVQPDGDVEPISGLVERVVTENGVTKLLVQGRLYGTEQVSMVG